MFPEIDFGVASNATYTREDFQPVLSRIVFDNEFANAGAKAYQLARGDDISIRPQCLFADDLDAAVEEIEADAVGDLPEVRPIAQFDLMRVARLPKIGCVVPRGGRESARRHDDTAIRAVELEGGHRQVEFLDDWLPDRLCVLALNDDDSPTRPVDSLFHEDVPSLAGSPVGLANVLLAEVPEDIFHQILEFESREVVYQFHVAHQRTYDKWELYRLSRP